MKAPATYEVGAQLTHDIVKAWKEAGETPKFRFPPKGIALMAPLDIIGGQLCLDEHTEDLLVGLCAEVNRAAGEYPTTMMLQVALEMNGIPVTYVSIAELGLGVPQA